jgi:Acetyltransferase (GNAT) domain
MPSPKERFQSFCRKNPDLPFGFTYEWYDTLFEKDEWDIVITSNATDITGFMCYLKNKKWGIGQCFTPMLTPYSGPYVRNAETLSDSERKKICKSLFGQISHFNVINIRTHPFLEMVSDFADDEYTIKQRITHILDLSDTKEELYARLNENRKRNLKKAKKGLEAVSTNNIEELFALKKAAVSSKGGKANASLGYLNRIWKYGQKTGNVKLLKAIDNQDNIHAMALFIHDREMMNYIYGATNPKHLSSGAMTLLLWEGIQLAKNKQIRYFNFEGSSIASIARFFKSFGSEPFYFQELQRIRPKWLKMLYSLKK